MLIHLTADFGTLATILERGLLRANRALGAVHSHKELRESQRVVSLSEISLAEVHLLAQRHGCYGVGLHRRCVQDRGGAPVWYLPRDSPLQRQLFRIVQRLAYRNDPVLDHPLWDFTPFIDYPRDPDSPGTPYDWRWEREWRHRGDLHFRPGHVAALFVPESQHLEADRLWRRGVGLPASEDHPVPPLIDITWSVSRQIAALKSGAANRDAAEGIEVAVGRSEDLDQWWLREPPDELEYLSESDGTDDHLKEYLEDLEPDDFLDEENETQRALEDLYDDDDFDVEGLFEFDREFRLDPQIYDDDDEDGSEYGDGVDAYDPDFAEQEQERASWLELAERDDF